MKTTELSDAATAKSEKQKIERQMERAAHIREILVELDKVDGDSDKQKALAFHKELGTNGVKSFDRVIERIIENPQGKDYPFIRSAINDPVGIEDHIKSISEKLNKEYGGRLDIFKIYQDQKYSRSVERTSKEARDTLDKTKIALKIIAIELKDKSRKPEKNFLTAAEELLKAMEEFNLDKFSDSFAMSKGSQSKIQAAFSKYVSLYYQCCENKELIAMQQKVKEEKKVDGILIQPFQYMLKFESFYDRLHDETNKYLTENEEVGGDKKSELVKKMGNYKEFKEKMRSFTDAVNKAMPVEKSSVLNKAKDDLSCAIGGLKKALSDLRNASNKAKNNNNSAAVAKEGTGSKNMRPGVSSWPSLTNLGSNKGNHGH